MLKNGASSSSSRAIVTTKTNPNPNPSSNRNSNKASNATTKKRPIGAISTPHITKLPIRTAPPPVTGKALQTPSHTQPQPELSARRTMVRWSEGMDNVLIDTLVEEFGRGAKKADNGWKPEALQHVVDMINTKFAKMITHENVRARLKTLKKDYLAARDALSQSGFRYDPESQTVIAETDAWDRYIVAYPDALNLRGKTIRHYDSLSIIIPNDQATGERAVSGVDIAEVNDTLNVAEIPENHEANLDEDVDEEQHNANPSQAPATSAGSSMHRSGNTPPRRHRRSCRNDDDLSSAILRIADACSVIASSFQELEWDKVEDAVRGVANVTEDDVLHIMQIFMEKPKQGSAFLGFSARMREAWVRSQLKR